MIGSRCEIAGRKLDNLPTLSGGVASPRQAVVGALLPGLFVTRHRSTEQEAQAVAERLASGRSIAQLAGVAKLTMALVPQEKPFVKGALRR